MIDRGYFGYIFEGKLRVRQPSDTDSELTKHYECALKILKTNLDESENTSKSEEDIKGLIYL